MTHTKLIEQLRAMPTSDLMRQAADTIEGLGRDADMIRLDFCHQHNGMPDQKMVTHDEMRQQFAHLSAENDRLTRALQAAINHPDDPQAAWHAGIAAGRDIERGNAAAQEPVCTVENDYNADGKSARIDEYLPAGTKLYAAPVAAQAQPAAGLDVEAVLRRFLTGDGFIAECDIQHIVAALTAQPAICGYTCTVPDDCETLHWRGQILSMNELASVAQPAVGEEIHVHIEGQDVLTLPLASSGMNAPRFVVHVPAQAQPVSGADISLLKDARHRIANLSRAAVPFDDPLDGPVLRRLDAAISAVPVSGADGLLRTDAQIVAQTEELARLLMLEFYSREAPDSTLFRNADDPRGRHVWNIACQAQEILTATDPENSVAELDDTRQPAAADGVDGAEAYRLWEQITAEHNTLAKQIPAFYRAARAHPQPSGNAPLHPVIREAIEAAFEQREGWMTKIAAAVRYLPDESQPSGNAGDLPTELDDLKLAYASACEERDHLRAALAAQASGLQQDVEALLIMLGNREYAEHWAKTEIGQRLEAAMTAIHGELSIDRNGGQDRDTDLAFEAVRKQLCKLPRHSFIHSDGAVRSVRDSAGNWLEFDKVHALFDPITVDAAREAANGQS